MERIVVEEDGVRVEYVEENGTWTEIKRSWVENGISHMSIPLFHPRWDVWKRKMYPAPSTKVGNAYVGSYLEVRVACDRWNAENLGFPGLLFCVGF
ncbi:MAG: hypothetical protein HYV54_02530 [Parcubacteria group bacterium]|nr:hypothetical protein [Parcubacteria group bacterium]